MGLLLGNFRLIFGESPSSNLNIKLSDFQSIFSLSRGIGLPRNLIFSVSMYFCNEEFINLLTSSAITAVLYFFSMTLMGILPFLKPGK